MPDPYIHIAAPLSLYSGKTRAYLAWKGIPHREVAVSPKLYKQKIIPAAGTPIIPVLETPDGEIWQDTTEIIDRLEQRFPEPSIYPTGPRQHLAALLLELFGDEWLLIPAMHYRWAYNVPWVFGEFGRIALPWAPAFVRRVIGERISRKFRGFVPMLGITEATIPAIERAYEAVLADLDAHFADHDHLFGARPSIGDYGLIGPLYAHLYRDPASGRLMKDKAPNVARWVERVEFPQSPKTGDFLPDDAVPDTLLPILRRQMREQIPVLQDTALKLAAWAHAHPDAERIPRTVGPHGFRIDGATGERATIPYSLWMLQRPLDFYHSLSGAAKAAADALLDQVDGAVFRDFRLPQRVARRNNRLVRG
ncbi:MAG: glutathione S-transferase family protein [Rhodothalassiaceae bacterium]